MSREEKLYWLFFSLLPEIGPKKFKIILNYFGCLKNAYQAGFSDFKRIGLDEKTIQGLKNKKREINLEKEWRRLAQKNINVITLKEEAYPRLLKEIYDPPPVIYYRGDFIKTDEYLVAVVGTRKPTAYGRLATAEIVGGLARNKLTIVSGLALGIDAIAHQATLENQGRTIAVLGSGLDQIHPRTNQRLAEKILEKNSLILSEFPLGAPPLKAHFPQRNRIIAGLCLGTLIIEAPDKSGALITARCALEQNREVFALPGPIFSKNSQGTNNLIKKGAAAVTSYADILEILNLEEAEAFRKNQAYLPETKEEKIILEILCEDCLHVDKIIERSKLEPSIINSVLSLMEMKGSVKNIGGMNFTASR